MKTEKIYNFKKLSGRIINLQEFRYVRIRTYEIEKSDQNDFNEEDLLRNLVSNPIYNDWLVGPEKELNQREIDNDSKDPKNSNVAAGQAVHGPFRIDKLTPEHYVYLSCTELSDRINDHFEDPFYLEEGYGPVPEEAKRKVHQFLKKFNPEKTKCFYLDLEFNPNDEFYKKELEPEVVVLSEFAEYLLIEPEKNRLHFLIVGFD